MKEILTNLSVELFEVQSYTGPVINNSIVKPVFETRALLFYKDDNEEVRGWDWSM